MIYLAIIAVGTFGLISSDNLIKKIMCLSIIENTIILNFLRVGGASAGKAPILVEPGIYTVDPIPQALMLTAIVIGVCFNALAVASIVRLHQKTGSISVSELGEL